MTAASPILRALTMYVLSLPVAIVLGYALATPLDLSNMGIFLVVALILSLPLLLRWHHPLLLLSWNAAALVFFLPGAPHVWLLMVVLGLLITLARRTFNPNEEIKTVTAVNWPLFLLAVTVLVTAQMTGGIHLKAMGSEESIGGKRYILILMAIAGFYAISLNRIPIERAKLFTALYFLGGTTVLLGTVPLLFGPAWDFLWYVFPVDRVASIGTEGQGFRYYGASVAAQFFVAFLFSYYGLRGLFLAGKPWRVGVLVLALGVGLFGGYRSVLIWFLILFALQFYLEGLVGSRLLMPIVITVGAVVTLAITFAPQLPAQVQRCLAFLPVQVDPVVRRDVEDSTRWRVDMWKAVLPEVPRHLLLGKGYAIDRSDMEITGDRAEQRVSQVEDYYSAMICSDFHNGPLSLLLPLGIWGFLAFAWFVGVGIRLLYRNYRYGDPAIKTVNTFLLAAFLTQTVMFYFVFGSFQTQLADFTGLLGLGFALNSGGAKPAGPTKTEAKPHSPLTPVMPRPRALLGRP